MMLENTIELRLLGIAALLGIINLFWGAVMSQRQRGFDWAAGSRDEPRTIQGVAARLDRALTNYLETFAIFAASLLGALMLHGSTGVTVAGAWLYVVARILYLPVYAAGTPKLRSVIWVLSIIGVLLEIFSLIF